MPEGNAFKHSLAPIPPILYESEVVKNAADELLNAEAAAKALDRISGDLQQDYFACSQMLGSAAALGVTVASGVLASHLAEPLRGVTSMCNEHLDATIAAYADPNRHGMDKQATQLKVWRAAMPALVIYKGFSAYPFANQTAREERHRLSMETFVNATAALHPAINTYKEFFNTTGKHDHSRAAQELTLLAIMNCVSNANSMFLPALEADQRVRQTVGVLVSNTPQGSKLRYLALRRPQDTRHRQQTPYQGILSTVDLGNTTRVKSQAVYTWQTADTLMREHDRAATALEKGTPLNVDESLIAKRKAFMRIAMRDAVVFDLK